LNQFANLSGGRRAKIVVVFTDRPDLERRGEIEQAIREALPVDIEFVVPADDPSQTIKLPAGATGIILSGEDQSAGSIAQLESIKEAWLSGTPLLAIDAGSAFVGSEYSASPRVPNDEHEAEPATHGSLVQDGTPISAGLRLLQASIEPNLLSNNRWGRLFSLAYHHPDSIAIGISEGSALLVDQAGGRVLGENVTVVLDLRNAALDLGSNRVFVIANGMLDVFVPGDQIEAQDADINSDPLRLATPVLSTATPLSRATQLPGKNTSKTPISANSTRFPRVTPSPTPTEVIEITDPRYLQSMVLLGTVSVLIILIGVWRNRSTK
jgi:cyanophycinase-like exopeptidase